MDSGRTFLVQERTVTEHEQSTLNQSLNQSEQKGLGRVKERCEMYKVPVKKNGERKSWHQIGVSGQKNFWQRNHFVKFNPQMAALQANSPRSLLLNQTRNMYIPQ